MSKKNLPVYILEKIWKFDPKKKIDDSTLDTVLIRPCDVTYRVYRNFSLGKKIRQKCVTHEACVASWFPNHSIHATNEPIFKNIEEFLIDANINKCVVPSFENWLIEYNWKTYYFKTFDLTKDHELLHDNQKYVLNILNTYAN